MKTNHRLPVLLSLLLLTAGVQEASAFYNPQTGRWLNRDPIGERGGKNNHAYADNDSINRFDFLGLHQFKLEKKPGYFAEKKPWPGLPGEYIGGETFFELSDRTHVEKSQGQWFVRAGYTSITYFWYSSPDARTHELHHVADDEAMWTEFVSEAAPYVDKPFCSKKQADCFQKVVDSLGLLYRKRADQVAAQFDCDEYDRAKGGKLGRCSLAATLKQESDVLAISIGVNILDCAAMK